MSRPPTAAVSSRRSPAQSHSDRSEACAKTRVLKWTDMHHGSSTFPNEEPTNSSCCDNSSKNLIRIGITLVGLLSEGRVEFNGRHRIGAIGGHSGFTVVIHNNGRRVFLWRPLNYTLPLINYKFQLESANSSDISQLKSLNACSTET